MIYQVVDSMGFHMNHVVQPPLLQLHGVGHEHRFADYDWYNAYRENGIWLFQYTLEGCGALRLGGQTYTITPGSGFLLTMPSDTRYFLLQEHTDGWRFLWVMFSGSIAEAYCGHIVRQYGTLFEIAPTSSAITALEKLHQQSMAGSVTDAFVAEDLTFHFLSCLCGSLSQPSSTYLSSVTQAKQIIETEFARLAGVAEIAERVGVSAEHLSRSFSKETGQSLMDALTLARMRQAVLLLRNPALTIEQVAVQCGYSCGNYFSKAFRRMMDISPNQFRRDALVRNYSGFVI